MEALIMIRPVQQQTVGVPPLERLKNDLLQRRANVLTAISEYVRRETYSGNQSPPTHQIQAALRILFIDLKPALRRWIDDDKKFQALGDSIDSDDFDNLVDAFAVINEWLDVKKIIRFDLEKAYDSTDIEEENEVKHT